MAHRPEADQGGDDHHPQQADDGQRRPQQQMVQHRSGVWISRIKGDFRDRDIKDNSHDQRGNGAEHHPDCNRLEYRLSTRTEAAQPVAQRPPEGKGSDRQHQQDRRLQANPQHPATTGKQLVTDRPAQQPGQPAERHQSQHAAQHPADNRCCFTGTHAAQHLHQPEQRQEAAEDSDIHEADFFGAERHQHCPAQNQQPAQLPGPFAVDVLENSPDHQQRVEDRRRILPDVTVVEQHHRADQQQHRSDHCPALAQPFAEQEVGHHHHQDTEHCRIQPGREI